jgi:hypothetical protein
MKPPQGDRRGPGVGRRKPPGRIPQIPMEWMDPMSWRLPSGKALAEFALQTGFLAPLMLGSPGFKKRNRPPVTDSGAGPASVEKHLGEGPENAGTFRETR